MRRWSSSESSEDSSTSEVDAGWGAISKSRTWHPWSFCCSWYSLDGGGVDGSGMSIAADLCMSDGRAHAVSPMKASKR